MSLCRVYTHEGCHKSKWKVKQRGKTQLTVMHQKINEYTLGRLRDRSPRGRVPLSATTFFSCTCQVSWALHHLLQTVCSCRLAKDSGANRASASTHRISTSRIRIVHAPRLFRNHFRHQRSIHGRHRQVGIRQTRTATVRSMALCSSACGTPSCANKQASIKTN